MAERPIGTAMLYFDCSPGLNPFFGKGSLVSWLITTEDVCSKNDPLLLIPFGVFIGASPVGLDSWRNSRPIRSLDCLPAGFGIVGESGRPFIKRD